MREKKQGTYHTLNTKRLSVQPSFRRQILDDLHDMQKKKHRQHLSRQKANAVFERRKIGRAGPSREKRPDKASDSCPSKKAGQQKHQHDIGVAWLREKPYLATRKRGVINALPKYHLPRKQRRQQPKT
jgi:hypothetical protein